MNISELLRKKIINVVDGETIGYIDDFIIDDKEHSLLSFVIKNRYRKEFIIPLEKIKTWGKDVILVSIGGDEIEEKKG